MLQKAEKINITGESVIGDTVVCAFSAVIDMANPEKLSVNNFQRNKEVYVENRATCRADFAEFEDYVYARHAEIVKAIKSE